MNKRYVLFFCSSYWITQGNEIGAFDTEQEAIKAAQEKAKEVDKDYLTIFDFEAKEFIDFDAEIESNF